MLQAAAPAGIEVTDAHREFGVIAVQGPDSDDCLLYTSDAADERSSVDLGGRRIIKKKTRHTKHTSQHVSHTQHSQQHTLQPT